MALLRPLGPAGSPHTANTTSNMNVGFTFSPRQASYLDVSWRQAFHAAMQLMPNLVRLGVYWDEIEPSPGVYDFSGLDWLIGHTPSQSGVLLSVGMKAPRWPEYYLPAWLERGLKIPNGGDVAADPRVRQATLHFIAHVVKHYRASGKVRYWQVENEPLDPSGPHRWRLDAGFLAQEVGLVRALDPTRPIVINLFVDTSPLGALPPWREALARRARRLLHLADILGLDIYPVRPITTAGLRLSFTWPVWSWEQRVRALQRLARASGRQIWISEAQAEPWLPARLIPSGRSPAHNVGPRLAASTVDRLRTDGFSTILLWGVEYWYMRSERYKDANWWSDMRPFFPKAIGSPSG